ncbi:SGNH/GDSL hydrolase family protein [Sphingomonas sp. RHCKR7]|uniref:SGNH/GDSL hydrolase family protein n=1 Tax=Sphingomonas folli TaxID=2862497 RepID=UPI001C935E20|nr:SGNH/GDSL hydrolase family protein [Sphingomonas folli]MBW6526424.1 SGNH/GDSL hydrolase family protein [Sphingomonas folli]
MRGAALLALVAAPAVAAPAALTPGSAYVALGSSYAAGAGIGAPAPSTPARCGQTVNNYPRLVARRLHLDLVDASCGGSTTTHLLHAWDELPAQLDRVTAATRLVTVTIGGNDVHLVGDLARAECVSARAGEARRCARPPAPTAAAWARLERNLAQVAREVRRRAPRARLVFVDYLDMLPARPCATIPYDAVALTRARATYRRLARVTAAVARRAGATLLRAGALSRGHDSCSAEPYAVGRSNDGASWHPTAAGHAAVAAALVRILDGDTGRARDGRNARQPVDRRARGAAADARSPVGVASDALPRT